MTSEVVGSGGSGSSCPAKACRSRSATVGRILERLGLNRRKFLDPCGETIRAPQKIVARWPGHMVHVDVKKVGRIPDGGGWRVHARPSSPDRCCPCTPHGSRRPNPTGPSTTARSRATSAPSPRSCSTPANGQRRGESPRHQRLEHPLQLPSTPHCHRRPAASITTQEPRHQRAVLEHLVPCVENLFTVAAPHAAPGCVGVVADRTPLSASSAALPCIRLEHANQQRTSDTRH